MQLRTARGLPGKRAPAITSDRKAIPTCILAIPQRIPLGKVKMVDVITMMRKPLTCKYAGWHKDTGGSVNLPPRELHIGSIKLPNSKSCACKKKR